MRFGIFVIIFAIVATIAAAQQVTLLFAGDAMQHQSQLDNAFRNGQYDYSSYFPAVKDEISQADIAVVNLEVTLGGKPYNGYPMFCAPNAYAEALKDAGFDIFLTANNHILDRFSKGMHRTLDVLDTLHVLHTGVFRNKDEREKNYPLLVNKNGIRLAFLNYTYGTNGMKPASTDFVNYINRFHIHQDIATAKARHADVMIANLHWGSEYQLRQNKEQENLARFLLDEGVDIVMGGHPHVVQPSWIMTDTLGNISNVVVYSLGNFVSGMTAVNTDGGQMIKIVLQKQFGKTHIVSCRSILIYTAKKQNGNKVDYSVVPIANTELDAVNQVKMKRFEKNARELFDQYNREITQ